MTESLPLSDLRSARTRRGFNLIEAAIVLGVVGLVIGGIWVAAASVAEKQRENQTLAEIGQIIANVRSLYKNMPGQTLVDLTDPSNSGLWSKVFPAEMLTTSGQVSDAWGSSVLVFLISGNSLEFVIGVIPKQACVSLGPRISTALRNNLEDHGGNSLIHVTDDSDHSIDTPSDAALRCSDAIQFVVRL